MSTLKLCRTYLLSFPFMRLDESPFALLGNKNWPPSMKVKKVQKYLSKSGSIGCKWSSLNAQGTENPLSHPLLGLEEFPFPSIGSLGVIRIGLRV